VPCILRMDARANADYEAWVHDVTQSGPGG
jgi:hypothetical protein